MKKFFALIAFAAFVSVQTVSAQTTTETKSQPVTKAATEEVKSESKEKSCHGASSASKDASCCKKGAKAEASHSKKASCCAKHEEKAEVKEEKVKGLKD